MTVHQILFGWAERDGEGNAGVRPLAHSGAPTIDRWAGRLQYVWATQDGSRDETDPTASLVHLVFEDEAAVLRKLPSRNVHGRGGATLTHVLVGDPQVIDARLALGLHQWTGWREHEAGGTGALLEPLDLADLRASARPGIAALRERVADIPAEHLTSLVARVLGDPAADFTVITRPGLALPMMTALRDIVGQVPGRPWTFAGRESTDVGSHQPRVVFLPARPPQSMYVSKRLRVEPALPTDPEGSRFAAQLVDLYLAAGHAALDRIRSRVEITTAEDVAVWRRSVPVVDGRIADPGLHRDILLDDDLLESLTIRGSLTSVRASLVGELRNQPAEWLVGVLERWHGAAPRAVRHPELREIAVSEAVQACLAGEVPDRLVRATSDARPAAATVASAFLARVPPEGLQLTRRERALLLHTALRLGLDAAELEREGLLAPTPGSVLMDFVGSYAAGHPDAAYAVLTRHLAPGGHDRGPHTGVAEVWFEHGLLLSQVERIAAGDRSKELDCYRLLITAVYGDRLTREDAAHLVERAGNRAPAGLLAAALEMAADDGAEQRIRREAAERYFREGGYSLMAPRSPGPPPRQAPGTPAHSGGRPQPAWGAGPYGWVAGPQQGGPDRDGPPGGTGPPPAPPFPAAGADWPPPTPRPDDHTAHGHAAHGHAAHGHAAYGHAAYGHTAYGHAAYGHAAHDHAAHGHGPAQGQTREPRAASGSRPLRGFLGHVDGVTLLFVSLCAAVVITAVAYIVLTTAP